MAGDIDGDCHVNVDDLLTFVPGLRRPLGRHGRNPACDLAGDNTANAFDLLMLVENFGL